MMTRFLIFAMLTAAMFYDILCLWQALDRSQAQREATISVLYKSLNRSVLYFLSRPRQTPAEKELILRTLQVFQQHWHITMATYNSSVHFISCLLHCLLLIRSGRSINFHPSLITNKKQIFVLLICVTWEQVSVCYYLLQNPLAHTEIIIIKKCSLSHY